MRVMCINDKWVAHSWNQHKPSPSVGDIDKVVNEEFDIEIGAMFYQLERFGPECWYRSDMFAILPDEPAEVIEEQEPEYATA